MKKIVSNIDVFPLQFQWNLNKKKNLTSKYSICFTILLICLSIFLIITFILNFLSTKSPQINQSTHRLIGNQPNFFYHNN